MQQVKRSVQKPTNTITRRGGNVHCRSYLGCNLCFTFYPGCYNAVGDMEDSNTFRIGGHMSENIYTKRVRGQCDICGNQCWVVAQYLDGILVGMQCKACNREIDDADDA